MTTNEKISFIWRLPLKRKAWLLACFFSSIFCLFIIYVLPSKYIHYFLGHSTNNQSLCVIASPKQILYAKQISSLMRAVANNVPWPCKCLAQALSVKWLLSLYRIPSVTCLGTRFVSSETKAEGSRPEMKAHAWLCVGPLIVIGRSKDKYTTVGTFTSAMPQIDSQS